MPQDTAGCLEVKSVGKPDAGKPHVRFDERGWEMELRDRLRHQSMVKAAGNSYSLSPNVSAPIRESTILPNHSIGIHILLLGQFCLTIPTKLYLISIKKHKNTSSSLMMNWEFWGMPAMT
jgi:hypothetical protein